MDAPIDWEASDIFGLGAQFKEQSSSSITTETNTQTRDALGNVVCETLGLNTTTEHANNFEYCNEGGALDIFGDLLLFVSQFGQVQSTKVITQIVITFTNGEEATVDITGHNHAENTHTDQDFADLTDVGLTGDVVPAGAGFGVPLWVGQVLGSATPVSATVTFSMEHTDREGADGNHFVGRNMTPKAELTQEFIGTPSTALPTGWVRDTFGPSDSIDDPDAEALTAHRFFSIV